MEARGFAGGSDPTGTTQLTADMGQAGFIAGKLLFALGAAGSIRAGGATGGAASLADDAVVVRGGQGAVPAAGQTFSGAAGRTLEEAASGVPHGTIRATTAGEIRQAGGAVRPKPELTRTGAMNDKHVDICLGPGQCPFGEAMPNPVPKSQRIQ